MSERERELVEQLANAERDGEQFCQRIAALETIIDCFVCYYESGVGQLTHILAAAEAAKEGAGT